MNLKITAGDSLRGDHKLLDRPRDRPGVEVPQEKGQTENEDRHENSALLDAFRGLEGLRLWNVGHDTHSGKTDQAERAQSPNVTLWI